MDGGKEKLQDLARRLDTEAVGEVPGARVTSWLFPDTYSVCKEGQVSLGGLDQWIMVTGDPRSGPY